MEQLSLELDLMAEENTVQSPEKWALYKGTAKTRQREFHRNWTKPRTQSCASIGKCAKSLLKKKKRNNWVQKNLKYV